MWADLGSGKSHTLQYIRQYFLHRPELKVLSIYAVMPKQIRNFIDVYRSLMVRLDLDFFADMFARICNSTSSSKSTINKIFPDIPDAGAALLKIMQAESEKTQLLAKEWLRATPGITRRQLDVIGVNRRITTTDDAVATLGGIIRIVQFTGEYQRVLFMLDECQRVGRFKLSVGQDVNTGLQTWYDSNPNRLTLIMSFGSGEEKFVRHLLSPELQSREDHLRISMPLLTRTEALDFIKELLECFRVQGAPSPWFPFTQELVEVVVNRITTESGVTPRVLMKAFEALLTEADYQIGNERNIQLNTSEIIQIVDGALRDLQTEEDD